MDFVFYFPADLPSAPCSPVAIRNTDTSVVVTWGASKDVKHLVGYYIESSVVGTDVWMPCNNKPVKQTRWAILFLPQRSRCPFVAVIFLVYGFKVCIHCIITTQNSHTAL